MALSYPAVLILNTVHANSKTHSHPNSEPGQLFGAGQLTVGPRKVYPRKKAEVLQTGGEAGIGAFWPFS